MVKKKNYQNCLGKKKERTEILSMLNKFYPINNFATQKTTG